MLTLAGAEPPALLLGERMGGFGDSQWRKTVNALFDEWETAKGKEIAPGKKGRVALKVYTGSGPGIATPQGLVLAVVGALEARGYERGDLVIYDLDEYQLREAGYFPPLSDGGEDFHGVPVVALENRAWYDPVWHYDSPLPSEELFRQRRPVLDYEADRKSQLSRERKSFLPVPLLAEMDFWINLPVAVEHPKVGFIGSLVNASLLNMSNNRRFFENPASAHIAVAEVAAIPELADSLLFTVFSLRRYQYIGGPAFNSLYTAKGDLLMLGDNLPAMDFLILQKLNAARVAAGFDPITPQPLFLEYARKIGLGDWEEEVAGSE